MSQGWVKTHRSKLNWEWFTDYKTSHLFEYLLLCASHNEYKWKGKTFVAGQLPFGLNKASVESGLSIQSIRTSLKRLKSTNEITIKTSAQGSVITVVNWDKYQLDSDKVTNKQQTSNKRSTTTKNVKNEKNEKKCSFSTKFVGLLKDEEIITWCKETGSEKIQDELYSQYDHSFLKGEITTAYYWQVENKKRKAGSFLRTWCERSNKPNKLNDKLLDDKLIEMMGGE